MIAPVACDEHDERALARADHRLARHQQRRLGIAAKRDGGEHARPQPAVAVGQHDPHGERAAVGLRGRQDRDHPASEALAGEARQRGAGILAHADIARARFGHRGVEPDGAEPAHLGERLAHGERHAGTGVERLDRARDRRRDRHHAVRPTAPLHAGDEAVGHAHQPQPLARSRGEIGLAEPPDAQIFGLRAAPFGQEQVRDRRAGADHVPGRSRIDAAHEPARTRLDDGDVALVEVDRAGDLEGRGKAAHLRRDDPQSQALPRGGIDGDRGGRAGASSVRVSRHELHIHEGRLAGLVELLVGEHRIVPVKDFACPGGRGRLRLRCLAMACPIACAAGQQRDSQDRCAPAQHGFIERHGRSSP